MEIFTRAWWDAAGARAANTAIAGAIPYITLILAGDVSPVYALSATALLALASLVTSLGGLAEVQGKTVPLWKAVLTRTLKTAGQSLVVWIGATVVLSDLDYTVLAVSVGGPVLITLLRTLREYLPETAPVVVADATKVAPVPEQGGVVTSVVVEVPPTEVTPPYPGGGGGNQRPV